MSSLQTQRQRYFILKGNLLFYYKSLKDRSKDPIGFICLEGYTVALEEGQEKRINSNNKKKKKEKKKKQKKKKKR